MASSKPIQTIPRVPEKIDFSMEEENILTLWKDLNVFYTCLKQSKGKPMFSFYDGPPFATGLPHYGHILAGTIKDVVTRYMHQHGYNVERRFGWDCHGLPVEYEIDKKLGIMGPEDVIKIGIAEYNKECRKIISRYANEWELVMNRLGRWIDFRNDYKTLYSWFMETVWWIFKQLYDKGMVYRGNKVMPYSTACNTPLSNFESGQNYKVVVDPAVTVTLPIVDDKDGTCLLIWTTTPWTLPSNLAACVHPSLEYTRVKQISTNKIFILMEARLVHNFHEGDYEIIEKFPGRKLMNVEYVPIFTYFQEMKVRGAFRVLTDEYVSSESGTGVVHQAPYFGEDDYRICLAAGLITKDEEPICPVDDTGRLTKPVTDFEGQYVKDADKNIISMLKQNGRLFNLSSIKHSYPYCWRSDTPLLYRAVPSWFIRVEFMTEKLQHTCSLTNWVPEFVKEKRFMNWLKEARDWAVSRNRYWGTPIPIWTSPNGDECVCVGSVAELEELTGTKIEDLHRENIDHLEISSKVSGKPPLKRTPEVFDCWFESGSMPYAQQHYPFENVKEFQEAFPADFVAEGIDQTRGWFYTLLVVSTALFGKPPYKNLIASGLILASDGQKMSKRKKNYPDPIEIVSKYGADALRLYLINSPVVRAENLHFKETGVRDIVKDVFLPWYNAFRFLMQNIENYVNLTKESFHYSEAQVWSSNIMDCWILSFTQSLLQHVHKEMGRYHLYNVVPCLTKYIDYLTNWYVRMNRPRLKGNGDKYDCKQALMTLFNVIFLIVKMMSPFSPFLVEYMYQYLKELIDEKSDSIHYLMLPQPNKSLINIKIERSVVRMQSVIELGRIIRDRKMLPMKYPLPEVVVIHQDIEYITDIKSLEHYILDELNVRVLTITIDKSLYGITLRAEPNYKMLGARLKQDFKSISCAIKSLTDSEINNMIRQGFRDFGGHRVELSEVHLSFKLDDIKSRHYEVNSDNDVLILLDCSPDSSMQEEGTAREIINRIQKLRKKAHLVPCDKISVFYDAEGELRRVIDSFSQYIEEKIKATFQTSDKRTVENVLILEDTQKLKDCKFHIILTREVKVEIPVVRWVNVAVLDIKTHYCNGATKGIILLQVDDEIITVDKLRSEIVLLFGIGKNFNIFTANGKMVTEGLGELSGQTLYVSVANDILCQKSCNIPFCKVTNFKHEEICGTLILENPQGVPTKVENNSHAIIQKWITKLSTPVF